MLFAKNKIKNAYELFKERTEKEKAFERMELEDVKDMADIWFRFCLSPDCEKLIQELEQMIEKEALHSWGEGTKVSFKKESLSVSVWNDDGRRKLFKPEEGSNECAS